MMYELLGKSLQIIGGITCCVSLPGTLELFALTTAALLPKNDLQCCALHNSWRVAIIVPAHNEEASIRACIDSLLRADRRDFHIDIYVIADNCTDNTSCIADAAGAIVLSRSSDKERGKGFALHFAFNKLQAFRYDCFLIVDADTEVAANFITATAGAMKNGAAAVQAKYFIRNLDEGNRTRLMGLALRAFNILRPLGRNRLGLSCGILGNGFGLQRETLEKIPYLASSVVEDLEYHILLVNSGFRVMFISETTVFGEMPIHKKDIKTQRSRWEGGRLRILIEKGPKIFLHILQGKFCMLEPLFDLLLLPLAFHMTLLLISISTPNSLIRDLGILGVVVVAFHLIIAITVCGGDRHDVYAIASAPFYIIWKLLMLPSLFRGARSGQAWVRTGRNADFEK